MGRIVLPEPKDIAARMGLRAQRQHADVQPTDGMANYRPEDIARTLAIAEHVRDEYALPVAKGIYASGNEARMNAARQKLGVDRQIARDYESPDDMAAIAMGVADKPVVESAVGEAMNPPDFEGMVARPFLKRRDVPIIAGQQMPTQPAPVAAPAVPLERAPEMPSLTVDAGVGKGMTVEAPQRAELPQPAAVDVTERFQQTEGPAQLPSYSLDIDENAIYDQNQLSSMVQAAKATRDPAQMSRVANIIDTQPMPDVVPETWSDFFMPDQHRQRVREKLKASLGLGTGGAGALDPLKVAEFRRKEAADAAKAPGWRADSHKKSVDAAYAETEAQQRVVTGDIKNDLNRLRALAQMARIPREVAAAELAQIKAAYGERETRAQIRKMNAEGWLAGERAKTEGQLRDDRQRGIQARTALDEQRTVESQTLLEPRRREILAKAGMYGRLPVTTETERSYAGRIYRITDKIAELEGEIAGHDQWLQANPGPPPGSDPNMGQLTDQVMKTASDTKQASKALQDRFTEIEQRKAKKEAAKKERDMLKQQLNQLGKESGFSGRSSSKTTERTE